MNEILKMVDDIQYIVVLMQALNVTDSPSYKQMTELASELGYYQYVQFSPDAVPYIVGLLNRVAVVIHELSEASPPHMPEASLIFFERQIYALAETLNRRAPATPLAN